MFRIIVFQSDLSSKTQLAVTYLENQLAGQSENSYSLAIMAYALAKANSNRATDAFNMLDAKAIVQGEWSIQWDIAIYPKTSDIRCTQSQNLNVSRLVLHLYLPKPLKLDVRC